MEQIMLFWCEGDFFFFNIHSDNLKPGPTRSCIKKNKNISVIEVK